MLSNLRIAFFSGTGIVVLLAIYFGSVAAIASASPRKAKARLIASLLFSCWLCLTPIARFGYEHTRPIYEFRGQIQSVQVLNSSSKYFSAWLRIATTSGGQISVHASDRSPFLRSGQQIWVRYRGDTGELVKALLYSADGKQEGVLQSTFILGEVAMLSVGLLCIWASIRKYRRDPEGAES